MNNPPPRIAALQLFGAGISSTPDSNWHPFRAFAWVFFFAMALAFMGCASKPVTIQRSFHLMGTTLQTRIEAPTRAAAIEAGDAVFQAVSAAEARLSTWDPRSELSALNHAPVGRTVRLSPLLDRDLHAAQALAQETDYAFSPWIGPLIDAWGLRTGGRIPASPQLGRSLTSSGRNAFILKSPGHAIRRLAGARVEEGGFGKGIGLDDARVALQARGIQRAVLDFGGQVTVLGEGIPEIQVADPKLRDRTLFRFRTERGPVSISTTGNSEHGVRVGASQRIGHILNPRSGKPAPFGGSVTVAASSGIEADALSTAIFVMGPERGIRWANMNDKQALWILSESPLPKAIVSCNWRPTLEAVSDTHPLPKIEIQRNCEHSKEKTHAS